MDKIRATLSKLNPLRRRDSLPPPPTTPDSATDIDALSPLPPPQPRPPSSRPAGMFTNPWKRQSPPSRPRSISLPYDDDLAVSAHCTGAGADLLRAARAVLTQAAALPPSRRHGLLAAAADLPELASLFGPQPGTAATAGAATTTPAADRVPSAGVPDPAAAPPPPAAAAAAPKLNLTDLNRKLAKLAAAVRAAPPPAPAAAAEPAPAPVPAGAELPPAEGTRTEEATMAAPEATTPEATAAAPADALTLSVIPEYEQYGLTAEEPVRAVVSIKAISEVSKRAKVALTCVLDRSGSMSGEPIDLVRQTVHFLIDQLTSDDWLGLVSYAGDVREDLPLLRMTPTGAALAHRVTDALCAQGSTALYDGLVAGIRQQMAAEMELRGGRSARAEAAGGGEAAATGSRLVHSCFLFTDGQATNGPSTPADIISGLQSLQDPSGQNVTVHTFGFGGGHSVELLQEVAEAQSGVYYYIQCTDDIASGFGDALGGLLAVVAKEVRVEVRPQGRGVTLAAFRSGGRVIGGASTAAPSTSTSHLTRPLRARSMAQAGGAAAPAVVPTGATFNDMFAEETRECLLVLIIPPANQHPGSSPGSESELAVVDLSYTDAATGARVCRVATLRVRRSATLRPAGLLPAELVFVTAARFETLDAIEAAQRVAAEAGGDDVSGAHKVLDAQLGRLQSAPVRSPALSALAEQTQVARASITTRAKRDQTNIAAVAGAVQALRHQRVATSTVAVPLCYAQLDYKCKSYARQTAAAKVSARKTDN